MKKFLRYAFKAAILLLFLAGCTVSVWNLGEAEAGQSVLTSTLGTPVGMQGFEGAYALNNPQEIVEIIVQFVTPPSVALRLMRERGIPVARMLSNGPFEEQALTAHDAFRQQLGQIPMPFGAEQQVEIFGEQHTLFNGVYMRVPAWMVPSISALPEVFAVFPNMMISIDLPPFENSASPNSFVPMGSFPHNNAARTLFNIDYIHNTLGFTGSGIRVAVLDTGIYYNHPDLQRYRDPATNRIRGWNFDDNNDNLADIHGHGTHVSGTVVAMAPDVELWHYRVIDVYGFGWDTWHMDAIAMAHFDGADIINFSIGIDKTNINHPVNYSFNLATLDGIICVIGAGNWHLTSTRPQSINVFGTASLPIVVGAGTAGGVGQTLDTIAEDTTIGFSSSRGPVPETFHIKPDIIAPGLAIHSTIAPRFWNNLSSYYILSGTSMAAPAVAGIAALMLEAFPGATPYEIKARIMNTARPLADLNPSSVFTVGAGFINPIEALTATEFVTVEHEVPWGTVPGIFETHTMSSLSFGSLQSILPDNAGTIPGTIKNTSSQSRTFTIGYHFTSNPGNAATITLSRTSISVAPGQAGNFASTISFRGNVPGGTGTAGFYEGYIYVREGGNTVARLPFGLVNQTATNVPARQLSFNLGGTVLSPTVPASIESINVNTGANVQDFIDNQHRGFTQRYGGFPLNGPTRAGYNFLGWYTNSTFTTPLTAATTMQGNDVTLFARWGQIVNVAPQVVNHPQNQTVNPGSAVSFSATATGAAPLTWQWQRSNDGVAWNAIDGANAATYSLTAQVADNGARFRVVISNNFGNATSNAATLAVSGGTDMITPLHITSQPQNLRVNAGETASFSIVAYGATRFQWQRMHGGRWRDIDGANAAIYSFIAQSADSGSLFRVMVSNDQGREVSSTTATLAVNAVGGGGASSGSSSGGCNTGAGLIAFALAGAVALITRKKIV